MNPIPSVRLEGGGDLRVTPFDGANEEWNGWLGGWDDSTFCHLAGWRRIMSDVLGQEPRYRVARDREGKIRGVLPAVRIRSRIFGHYLVSMPFLNYGGPVGTDEARVALGADAVEEARGLGVDLLELRSRTPVPGNLRLSERKITVLMELPETSETLWEQGLKAKVRSQIRRPMKEGMTARFGLELWEPFYEVFSRTMRQLGTPVLPRRLFQAITEEFPESALFSVVELAGEPVAAGCGFLWNGEVEMTWAGALNEFSRMAPNMLLYWSLMEESIRRGARVFNFGRCSPGSGTHRFKRQWGGQDYPLPWAQWSSTGVEGTPAPTSRKYRLATAAWKKLPLAVANRLGPVLSRQIP